jgi:hypothetical protein
VPCFSFSKERNRTPQNEGTPPKEIHNLVWFAKSHAPPKISQKGDSAFLMWAWYFIEYQETSKKLLDP